MTRMDKKHNLVMLKCLKLPQFFESRCTAGV